MITVLPSFMSQAFPSGDGKSMAETADRIEINNYHFMQ
jgi:hypothetical protein